MGIIISPTSQEHNKEKGNETSLLSKLKGSLTTRKVKKPVKSNNNNKVSMDNKLLATFSVFETKYPDILHQYIVQYHLVRTFEFPKKKRHRLSTKNIPTVNNPYDIDINPRKLPKLESPPETLNKSLDVVSIAMVGGQNLEEYQQIKEEFIYEFIEFEKKQYAFELSNGLKLNFFDMIEEFMKQVVKM